MLLYSTLMVVILLICRIKAQVFFLNDQLYLNNSAIFFEEIGEGNRSLNCQTNKPNCCKGLELGEWHYPNGTTVPIKSMGYDFYRERDDFGNVKLNRRSNARRARGAYYCIFPNIRDMLTKLTMYINSPEDYPEVIEQPQHQLNVDPGSNVSFSVVGNRSTAYYWYLNRTIIFQNPLKYVGIRHSILTILNVSSSDVGLYSCIVANRILSVFSDSAELSLLSPPSILMNPEDVIGIELGSNVTFSIMADGIRFAYQWKRGDDSPLPTNNSRFQGVTTRSLTILNVQLSDTGSYICVVSNAAGRVVSTGVMLTIRLADAVDSINVTTAITSAVVSWSPSTEPQLLTYELLYSPTLFPYSISTLNTTFTSHEVTGLIPRLQYRFQVRVYTSIGPGDWLATDVTLAKRIPAVSNLSAVAMNGPSIMISWSPSVLLPGWNISYYYLSYSVLLPPEAKPRAMFMSTVKGSQTSEVVEADKLVVKPDVLHMFEVSAVLKINGLEGIGEVRGEKTSTNISIEYEELPFQLMIGPIDYCVHWNDEKASSIRAVIHRSLVQAISARCACRFSEDSISSGYFSCRNSKTSVIYRSTIIGLNVTELIGYIQNWVDSSTTLLLDWFYVDVYNICPVKISKLDEVDCQFTDSNLLSTLTNTNHEVIKCINTCLHSTSQYNTA